MSTQYRIGAVDFEEQLEHGLGVEKMPPLQIFGLWLYIVKRKISRGKRRGWLDACKKLIEKVDSSNCVL